MYDADPTRMTYDVVATMTLPKVNWHFMFAEDVANPVLFERFDDGDSLAKNSTDFGLNPTPVYATFPVEPDDFAMEPAYDFEEDTGENFPSWNTLRVHVPLSYHMLPS